MEHFFHCVILSFTSGLKGLSPSSSTHHRLLHIMVKTLFRSLCLFLSSLYWMLLLLLLWWRKYFILEYWMKPCPHLQSTVADLHNTATQHQVARHTVVVHHSTTAGPRGPSTCAEAAAGRWGFALTDRIFLSSRLFETKLSGRDPTSCWASFIRRASAVLRRGEMWNSFGPQERSDRWGGGNMWEWVRGPEKTEQ